MTDYISREAALELLDGIYDCNDMVFRDNDSCVGLDCGSCRWRDTRDYIRDRLTRIPAADVAPVVRCGECKWSDNYGLDLMCQKHSGITKNKLGEDIHFVEWHSRNFFCADGERTENDG